MEYISTRNKNLQFGFKEIFLQGLAQDGGLFISKNIKKYSNNELNKMAKLNYIDLAKEIVSNFCEKDLDGKKLDDGYQKSIKSMIREVERCDKLGIPYLVTHLGSHKGSGEENGMKRLTDALNKVAETSDGVVILLENTAGQKNSVGSDFKQLAQIFSKCKPPKKFGICLDTCHAFVAGYDLRTKNAVKKAMKEFDDTVGIKHLKILHLNDSKGELNSNRDRHDHIGIGEIGKEGLGEIIKIMNKHKIPIVLETPIDDIRDDFGNIKQAKSLV